MILKADAIISLDERQPRPEAVLCRDGRIVATGSLRELRALDPGAEVQEHAGRVITPGLTDAHLHPVSYGFSLRSVPLDRAATLEAGLEMVRERCAARPAGEWIQGFGFHRAAWNLAGHPEAAWLDPISPDHPVLLRSRDGHAAWLNSRALEAASITPDTPDPPGGRIERDAHGQPTGTLLETATQLAFRAVPAPGWEAVLEAARDAVQGLRRLGFTAMHSMAAEPPEYLRALLELEARRELPVRVWASVPHAQLEALESLGLRGGLGDRVRLAGVKFFTDGALGSKTAWMLEPYLGTQETGIGVDAPETILERGRRAVDLGYSVTVHAIGDRANREVLGVFETLAPLARARGVRLRLEHAQHLVRDDIARIGRLGVVASMQAIHLPGDVANIDRTLGPERAATSFAFRDLQGAGAVIALGSDAPIATPDPVAGFHAAVHRLAASGEPWQQGQRLTRLETLEGYTKHAAFAAGWEGWYGQIGPGFAADFTVWDADPTETDARPLEALSAVGS